MLRRALRSVELQTLQPTDVVVSTDTERVGAPKNRDNGLARLQTEFVAFLYDDDELYPQHLQRLYETAVETEADLVFPWFDVGSGGSDPFPWLEGVPWDNSKPHQVPITLLARTEVIRAAGGYSYEWDPTQGADPGVDEFGNRAGEDYRLILRLCASDRKIFHLPERTWLWHHHGRNTSGLPSRW